jgi:hypothetical protein
MSQSLAKFVLSELLDMAAALGELKARIQALEARPLCPAHGTTTSRTCSPSHRTKLSPEALLKAGEVLAQIGPPLWRGLLWLLPRAISWGGALWGLGSAAWQMLSPLLQRVLLP